MYNLYILRNLVFTQHIPLKLYQKYYRCILRRDGYFHSTRRKKKETIRTRQNTGKFAYGDGRTFMGMRSAGGKKKKYDIAYGGDKNTVSNSDEWWRRRKLPQITSWNCFIVFHLRLVLARMAAAQLRIRNLRTVIFYRNFIPLARAKCKSLKYNGIL